VRRAALLAALLALPAPALGGVRPVRGGEIVVALPGVPREADPLRAREPADLVLARALHATLLEVDAAGALVPLLLAEVPVPEAGGRAFRLRLRPGLTFADGTPLRAADVAASLARLSAAGAPHGWLALAFEGASRGTRPAVQVLSDVELLVALDEPLPELPFALAALPGAVVSARGAGAGPFRLAEAQARGPTVLAANEASPRGRPFADRLVLAARPARAVAAEIERGETHLALRPEPLGRSPVALAPTAATYAAANEARLGAAFEPVRRAVAAIDRAELARRFVRGPSEPLATFLPRWVLAAPVPTPTSTTTPASPFVPSGATPEAERSRGAPTAPRLPARPIVLLVPTGVVEARAAADRIQVKLFDAGIRASVSEVDPVRFAAAVAAREHDVAVVTVPILAACPSLAAAQIAWTVAGRDAAAAALRELAGLSGDPAAEAAERVAARLGIVPLFASGLRASPGAALAGLAPRADGSLDLGDLWLFRGGAPR
jgi:peptide/nickel transport system substrate-binding protein